MNESLKELAVRYFEGPIAPEEECELFGFLAASPENAALMREWEREWKQRHVPSADVLRSLARLNGKIERRENRIRARRRWLRFSGGSRRAHPDLGLHHPAPHTHRRPRANVLRTGSPGNQQPHIAARRQPGVAQRRIDLELPVGFQPLVARHRPFGRSLLRGGPQRRPPLPGAGRGCTFTVLGTRFNISAYDEDPDVLAALMEGSLQFESSRSTETMVPGDLITYDCRTMEASRRQVDTDQFRSWIDGIIRYDAISLPALLRRLAREYDVKIELCTDAFDDKTFRISLTEAQDIESIMGGLCDILPISVRRDTCGYRVDSRPRKTKP